jgi:hypothetical protein
MRLIATDSTIYDACGHSFVAGGATVSTDSPIKGLNSIAISSNTPYLPYNSDFVIGSDEFTMATWLKASSIIDLSSVINMWNTLYGKGQYAILSRRLSPYFSFYIPSSASGAEDGFSLDYNTDLRGSIWRHLAVTYDKTTIRLFINGIMVCSENHVLADVGTCPYDIRIGWSQYDPAARTMNGFIFDPCILKGCCLWKSNFAIPTDYVYNEYFATLDMYKDKEDYLYGYK